MMNLLRRGAFFSIILCLFAIYSIAQTNLAGISGKVSGTNNTPLPGAFVLVKNESTGFQIRAVSMIKVSFS